MESVMDTHGSVLLVTAIGAFLNAEISLASWATSLVESSRSFATFTANFPVSFWIFCKPVSFDTADGRGIAYLDVSLDLSPQLM